MAFRAIITGFLAVTTAAFIAAFFMPSAQAMVCFDRHGLMNFHQKFGEEEVARAELGSDGHKMILMANPKTKTWTMMIVRKPDGMVCPFASGDDFQLIKPIERGEKI
tara:strand:+ start:107 stop:427 length:321 start_codon:yes stop_codon:yes gene_type:complete